MDRTNHIRDITNRIGSLILKNKPKHFFAKYYRGFSFPINVQTVLQIISFDKWYIIIIRIGDCNPKPNPD